MGLSNLNLKLARGRKHHWIKTKYYFIHVMNTDT